MRHSLSLLALLCLLLCSCDFPESAKPTSASGVAKATATVSVQANGLTVEQENITKRLQLENRPGSIKHLYVFSAYSGQCMLYSTVKGKVTSSGKRLTPVTVAVGGTSNGMWERGFEVDIGGYTHATSEVLQDDGTYGSSAEYLYWFDSKGVYHQHYVSGGTIVHVSDQPLAVKSVTINVEER